MKWFDSYYPLLKKLPDECGDCWLTHETHLEHEVKVVRFFVILKKIRNKISEKNLEKFGKKFKKKKCQPFKANAIIFDQTRFKEALKGYFGGLPDFKKRNTDTQVRVNLMTAVITIYAKI